MGSICWSCSVWRCTRSAAASTVCVFLDLCLSLSVCPAQLASPGGGCDPSPLCSRAQLDLMAPTPPAHVHPTAHIPIHIQSPLPSSPLSRWAMQCGQITSWTTVGSDALFSHVCSNRLITINNTGFIFVVQVLANIANGLDGSLDWVNALVTTSPNDRLSK